MPTYPGYIGVNQPVYGYGDTSGVPGTFPQAPSQVGNSPLRGVAYDIPAGWGNVSWSKARAQSKSRLVKIAVIGDSISLGWQGTVTANWWVGGYLNPIRAVLQSQFGNGGSGFVTVDYCPNTANALVQGAYGTSSAAADWTRTPDGGGANSRGGVNYCSVKNAVSGVGALHIPVYGNASCKIYALTDPAYGSYDYSINSGATTNVPVNAASSISTTTIPPANLPSSGASVYNVDLLVHAASTVELYGVAAYNATGIAIDNLSSSARNTGNLLTNTPGINQNPNVTTFNALGPWDLIIYALSVNDIVANVTATATNLASSWSALKNASPAAGVAPDTIVLNTNFGIASTFGDTNLLEANAAMEVRRFAQGIGAAVVDMWAAAGRASEPWNSLGWQAAGNVHPNVPGHQQYANALLPVLLA